MGIKCRNPSCGGEVFKVEVESKKQEVQVKSGILSVPVTLVCAKCGQKVQTYVVNNQLREVVKAINSHDEKLTAFINAMNEVFERAIAEQSEPFWKRLFRKPKPIVVELCDDGLEALGIEG